MEDVREPLIHLSAQKLADWHSGEVRLDLTRRSVRDDLSRALQEAGEKLPGGESYLRRIEGNELAALQDEIVEVATRLLRSSG